MIIIAQEIQEKSVNRTPQVKKLGIFFLSFEKSSRINREKILREEILSIVANISDLEVVYWRSSIWQPPVFSKLKVSYGKYLRFKYLSEKAWYGQSGLLPFIRVLYNEIDRIRRGVFLKYWSKNRIYRDKALTEKHFRSWVYAIDSGVDFALFLEDDIDVENNLDEVLRNIATCIDFSAPTYLNLSKGNDLSVIRKEISVQDKDMNWFRFSSADTTAAYLVNKECLKILTKEFSCFGNYDALGIDFILSWIFLKNKSIRVLHNFFPPFSNGTLLGKYQSELNKQE